MILTRRPFHECCMGVDLSRERVPKEGVMNGESTNLGREIVATLVSVTRDRGMNQDVQRRVQNSGVQNIVGDADGKTEKT